MKVEITLAVIDRWEAKRLGYDPFQHKFKFIVEDYACERIDENSMRFKCSSINDKIAGNFNPLTRTETEKDGSLSITYAWANRYAIALHARKPIK